MARDAQPPPAGPWIAIACRVAIGTLWTAVPPALRRVHMGRTRPATPQPLLDHCHGAASWCSQLQPRSTLTPASLGAHAGACCRPTRRGSQGGTLTHTARSPTCCTWASPASTASSCGSTAPWRPRPSWRALLCCALLCLLRQSGAGPCQPRPKGSAAHLERTRWAGRPQVLRQHAVLAKVAVLMLVPVAQRWTLPRASAGAVQARRCAPAAPAAPSRAAGRRACWSQRDLPSRLPSPAGSHACLRARLAAAHGGPGAAQGSGERAQDTLHHRAPPCARCGRAGGRRLRRAHHAGAGPVLTPWPRGGPGLHAHPACAPGGVDLLWGFGQEPCTHLRLGSLKPAHDIGQSWHAGERAMTCCLAGHGERR